MEGNQKVEIAFNLLKSLLASTDDAIGCFDLNYNYIIFNKKHEEEIRLVYGIDLKVGINIKEVLKSNPDDLNVVIPLWNRVLSGQEFYVTSEFGSSALQKKFFKVKFSPVYSPEGSIIGGIQISRDVSTEINTVNKLRRNERILDHFFNESPLKMGLVELLPHDILHIAVNPATASFYDRPVSDIIYKKASELGVKQKFIDLWIKFYKEAEASGEPQHFQCSHEYMEKEVWFEVIVSYLGEIEGETPIYSYLIEDITQKRESELKWKNHLIASGKSLFAKIIDHSPSMLWITEANGDCTYLSRQWYEFTGAPIGSGMGTAWFEAFHPDDMDSAIDKFHEFHQKHLSFGLEIRVKNKYGQYRWCVSLANPRFDDSSNFLGFIGSVFDVHERKIAEDKLNSLNTKLESIFSEAPAGLALLRGPNQIYELANPYFLEIADHREIIGKENLEAFPELEGQIYAGLLNQVYMTGENVHMKEAKVHLTRQGKLQEYYYDFSCIQIRDSSNRPYGIFMHVVDVTDKIRVREMIVEADERLQLAMESGQMGSWFFDLIKHSVQTTPELNQILGIDEKDATLFFMRHQLLHPEDIKDFEDKWNQSIYDKVPLSHEFRVIKTDGQIRWLLTKGKAKYDQAGRPVSISGITMDISESKNTEELLRDALKARDEFLSMASHELKTPLTSLKLHAQMMKKNIHGEKENVKNFIEKTNINVTRLTRLVDDMLDISRIKTGNLSLVFEEVDLCELVKEVVERLRSHFIEIIGHTPITSYCHKALGHWDRMRIEQVANNLLTNAIRYGKGQPIEISVERIGDFARLNIKDYGIGISEDNLEKIFDRFERGGMAPNEISGLGLGLYITKKIVNAHKGKIWVESEVGKGSTFIVELPIKSV